MMIMNIPLSSVDLSERERNYVSDAMASGWISATSVYVDKAERAFAGYCGVDECTLVPNGTAALHLALMSLDVRPGDEIIVPGMTFVSPAAVVSRLGAIPVIADVEKVSWCISPVEIERLITEKTKGIIAVDLLGHPADYDVLRRICDERRLFLVEDAAQAHGSKYKGHRTGSLGDLSTFSFFANKTFACGEGGAVLSSNHEVISRARLLKNHGMTKERPYWHEVVGDNFRLTGLQAAILLGQIERADEICQKKKRIAALYREELSDFPGIEFRPSCDWADVVPWLEVIRVLPGAEMTRDALVQKLRKQGVDARALWTPIVDLPPYRKYSVGRNIQTPLAKELLGQALWLPTSSVMTDEQVHDVARAVRAAFQE